MWAIALGAPEMAAAAAGHAHTAAAIVVAADGAVVTGGVDGSLCRWTASPFASLGCLGEAAGRRSAVRDLAASPDGAIAVATDWDGRVEVWRGDLLERAIDAFSGRVVAVAWAGDSLVAAGADLDPAATFDDDNDDAIPALQPPVVRVFSPGAPPRDLAGLTGTPWAVAASADGARIAGGGSGPAVVVWEADTGRVVATVVAPGEVGVLSVVGADLVAMGSRAGFEATGVALGAVTTHAELAAPARAGWADELWRVAGGFSAARITRPAPLTVPGRAYDVARVDDELWILLSDRVVRVGPEGAVRGEHSLR